jgi:hypothetical protein
MLAAIRGEPADQLAWAPRMDLWYMAQRARGTLPPRLAGLNTAQLADAFGVGCRSLSVDRLCAEEAPEDGLLGLGIENYRDFPFRVEIQGLQVAVRREGDLAHAAIRTPAGEVTTVLELTDEMRCNGITVPYARKFAIESSSDLEPVAQVFEHLAVIPTPEGYAAYRRRIGESGLAIAQCLSCASPMQMIFYSLMAKEMFFYLYADEPDAVKALAGRMEPFYDKVIAAVAACEAETVLCGVNFDQNLTWPAFFEKEISPWLRRVGERMHAAGKIVVSHTDGENHMLLPLYPKAGFDVAESVCPRPMTRCTLREIREGMGSGITVWGGLCSIAFLRSSMDDAAFEAYLDQTFGELGSGGRLILGVSDNVPPDADLDRLERVKQRIREFGSVQPA